MDQDSKLRLAMLASVAHDLKTPLVSVIGSLSTLLLVKDDLLPEERQQLLESACREAERLHHIVHNVLEMAKLESGSNVLRKVPLDLTEIVKVTAARIKRLFPDFKLTLENDLNGLSALGDELLISQVVYNLFDNAVKYGSADLKVLVRLLSHADNQRLQIQVVDNGKGISPNELPHIFNKFYRGKLHSNKQSGSGLGLAICRTIVEAHGGTIEAYNRTDDGTGMVFSITLPGVDVRLHE